MNLSLKTIIIYTMMIMFFGCSPLKNLKTQKSIFESEAFTKTGSTDRL